MISDLLQVESHKRKDERSEDELDEVLNGAENCPPRVEVVRILPQEHVADVLLNK